jgi:hypothetical protein
MKVYEWLGCRRLKVVEMRCYITETGLLVSNTRSVCVEHTYVALRYPFASVAKVYEWFRVSKVEGS